MSRVHPTVCAVVVTYNRKDLLRNCLRSLLEQTLQIDEILVIDNASIDGTSETLRSEFPTVTAVRLETNTGGAGGFHRGIKLAYERGFDWVWIMDDDVRAAPQTLAGLLAAAEEQPSMIPAPLRLWEDGSIAEGASLVFDLATVVCLPGGHQKSIQNIFPRASMLPPQQDVEGLTFEGPLLPRSAIGNVGYPCKGFFIHGDDTEYSIRLKRAGYRLCLIRDSVLYRQCTAASRLAAAPAWKARYIIRNTIWINRMHGENRGVRYVRTWLWFACYLASGLLKLRWVRDPVRWLASMRGLVEAVVIPPGGPSRA